MQIVIALADLELALKWAKQNSLDVTARVEVDGAKLKMFMGTPNSSEVVQITLYSADSSLQPKVQVEQYLKHVVKA